jgi:hypothetical protein
MNGRGWVRRINLKHTLEHGIPTDGSPWVADCRSFDIPPTIAGFIRNVGVGCVAVSLSMFGGKIMIEAAEQAARERGVRVLWWFGPGLSEIPDDARARMRGWVRDARRQEQMQP